MSVKGLNYKTEIERSKIYTHTYIYGPLITVLHETKWRHLEIYADILDLLRFPFKPMLWHFVSSNMD